MYRFNSNSVSLAIVFSLVCVIIAFGFNIYYPIYFLKWSSKVFFIHTLGITAIGLLLKKISNPKSILGNALAILFIYFLVLIAADYAIGYYKYGKPYFRLFTASVELATLNVTLVISLALTIVSYFLNKICNLLKPALWNL